MLALCRTSLCLLLTLESCQNRCVGGVCACLAAGCVIVVSLVIKNITGMIRGADVLSFYSFCGYETVFSAASALITFLPRL
jgi:hypothetical protein